MGGKGLKRPKLHVEVQEDGEEDKGYDIPKDIVEEEEKQDKGKREYNWMFTSFRCCESIVTKCLEETWASNVKFVVCQLETCPETERDHIQGYMELKSAATLKTVQGYLGDKKAHLEVRKGTQEQAIAYCTKEETRKEGPFQFGQKKEQGKRSDLSDLCAAVVAGVDIREVALMNPSAYTRNYRGLQDLANKANPPAERGKPKIFYYHGGSGIGKSRLARLEFPRAYHYNESRERWFDGYLGEKEVIIDEFSGTTPVRDMLKLLDYGPLQLPVKGGFATIKADTFVFTSNYAPEEVYSLEKDYGPWMRRIREFGVVIGEETIKKFWEARAKADAENAAAVAAIRAASPSPSEAPTITYHQEGCPAVTQEE